MASKLVMEQKSSIRKSSRMGRIDFSVFEMGKGYKSKCEPVVNNIIKECKYLFRLTTALKYYDILKTSDSKISQDIFTQFCDAMYVDLLDDVAHFNAEHAYEIKPILAELIQKYGFKICRVNDCVFTNRHYDERRPFHVISNKKSNPADTDPEYIFYEQIMDAFHFNIFHLYDVGLRCKLTHEDAKEFDPDQYNHCIDTKFAKLRDIIHNKRKQYANPRFSARDNKFNISIGFQLNCDSSANQQMLENVADPFVNNKNNGKKKTVWKSLKRTVSKYFGNEDEEKTNRNMLSVMELTWADNMWLYMMTHGVDKEKILAVRHVFFDEEYDTDSVIAEFEAVDTVAKNSKFIQQKL